MTFTFLKATGEVAFFRSDAEQAEWTTHEMSLLCSFPLDNGKIIERGMRVLFQDPATGDWQAYEIRNCIIYPGTGFQQFTAEDIAISELTDCHIGDTIEMTDITAQEALADVLSGTGWSVGANNAPNTSYADIGRGSVWQAVCTIRDNWNVYIMPRVTVNSTGITGKYLDIIPAKGEWRGLRLSINKNVSDPCVTYDDSELYTALYGYGASYTEGEDVEEQVTLETNFAEVVWAKEKGHPAKPYGQTYLEQPEKTALYGRNGKPRFGYYQNTEIDDPRLLLQKTWETLSVVCDPKINITGTCSDLKRLGYADQPIRLHDLAIVDVMPTGETFYEQVTQLIVDLLDATKDQPTIGRYIPNIVYINRATEDYATGGSTGVSSGGSGGSTRSAKELGEFETEIKQNERNIILEARQVNENREILRQAGMEIDPITGVLIYAEDNENMVGSKFRVQSNRITAEVEQRTASDNLLSSRITQTANSIALEVSERKGADSELRSSITVTANQIRSEVSNVDQRLSSRITQTANSITAEVNRATAAEGALSGRITVNANSITAEVTRATTAEGNLDGRITVNANNITAEVTRATTAEGNLSGRLTITENNISAEVTRATDRENYLSGRITVNSDMVGIVVEEVNHDYVVKAASIVAGINDQSGSYVKIDADTINLTGYVTASQLSATQADIDNLKSGQTVATMLKAGILYANTSFDFKGHSIVSWECETPTGNKFYALGYAR